MTLRPLVRSQQAQKLESLRNSLPDSPRPQMGWLAYVRQALGMSAAQLARRAGVSRVQISNLEKSELVDSPTLRTMRQMADALNCDFVYFLVPRKEIDAMLEEQATKVARRLLRKAGEHMSLEGQQLDPSDQEREVKRLAQKLIYKMPRSFWDDDL